LTALQWSPAPRLLNELAGLMIYEVCRDMPLQDVHG
jgi:hypothetical protein